jgi:hypothetical protein
MRDYLELYLSKRRGVSTAVKTLTNVKQEQVTKLTKVHFVPASSASEDHNEPTEPTKGHTLLTSVSIGSAEPIQTQQSENAPCRDCGITTLLFNDRCNRCRGLFIQVEGKPCEECSAKRWWRPRYGGGWQCGECLLADANSIWFCEVDQV